VHTPSCTAYTTQVWDLANSQRAGYLDKQAFIKAMELISLAQQVRSGL
jgi:hypothetical protein